MYTVGICLTTSWVIMKVLSPCYCQNSVENVILARKVINEVHMKDYNYTSDDKRNHTMDEINKYMKNNPSAKELMEEDKKAYADGEKQGKLT